MHYSRAFDETYLNSFTSDNISDTSDEEELKSSDKDYEGGEAQGNKDDETTESNENFDFWTIIDASVLQSMLDNFAVCKYCHNELNVFLNTCKYHTYLVEFGILSVSVISVNLGSFPQGQ